MSQQYFHFTIGPVQGFVAQARRTRDFWAGSFILSWLSAVAMRSVQAQEGIILFPLPDDAFMQALESDSDADGPKQGNIPNRFKAEVSAGFNPQLIVDDVQKVWKALADLVWQKDFGVKFATDKRVKLWNQQVESFWDISWAISDNNEDSDLLDRLKNWRTYLPPDQPGVKCMMMDGWQELSAEERPGKAANGFWIEVRKNGKSDMKTDLREGEMLCAIAYIKRRFARYFKEYSCQMDGWKLIGWKLPKGVPSVDYLAVAHWLSELILRANKDGGLLAQLQQYHKQAYELTGQYGEWESNIRCVKQAVQAEDSKQNYWTALDGEVFFKSTLENAKLWKPDHEIAKDLAKELKALREAAELPEPTPYYAILLMDGDELGIHMSDVNKQKAISESLAKFTQGVNEIVDEHSGFLIYAGGDDVLAILPMEDALCCATELRRHYRQAFASTHIPSSLSGAIEYAHVKTPLGKILKDAHDLLDNVVKEKYGRDAIACRVWNNAGMMLQWAMPWHYALSGDLCVVDQQAKQFREQFAEHEPSLASGFFYRIRELLQFSLADAEKENRQFGTELLASTLLNSGLVDKNWDRQKAESFLEPLLSQCYPRIRDKDEKLDDWPMAEPNADAAMLVRFLAMKGMD